MDNREFAIKELEIIEFSFKNFNNTEAIKLLKQLKINVQ